MKLEELIQNRHSCRKFSDKPIPQEQIDKLWESAIYAPSAGAIRPFEIFPITDVEKKKRIGGSQEFIGTAGVVFVFTADFSAMTKKYGERGKRYVYIEAGHAAQNVLLTAESMGLGAVPIGAFKDDEVKKVLSLPDYLDPIYLVAIGHKE